MNRISPLSSPITGSHSSQIIQTSELYHKASEIGFVWDNPQQILKKISDEIHEVQKVFEHEAGLTARIEEEIGDALMTVISFCIFMQLNPEEALRKSNEKFAHRFEKVQQLMKNLGLTTLEGMDTTEKLQLWEEAKKL